MASSYLDLIVQKRDGRTFTPAELEQLVRGIVEGDVPDHQIGALLMAIYLNGLNAEETVALTMAMVHSGATVDLSSIEGFKVDKHSTGGVGDKVTLVLGPLVAAAGVKFPKLSGRGLAHTGGTLDKLESIPSMRVDLSLTEFVEQVAAIGLAVTGQTQELVPADGVIYELRNQTGTVDSAPLIASSVMSKKIAAGADGIILDVKCGKGAFMKTVRQAETLARQMVDIGQAAGKTTRALVTSMDQPLGLAVGNALEVAESIAVLHGEGPEDLVDEVLALGAEILVMAGVSSNVEAGRSLLRARLHDGTAAEKLRQMITWQGGNATVVDDVDILPRAERVLPVLGDGEGYVQAVDAMAIGTVAMELGAGRRAKNDPVAPSAGVLLHVKPGPDRIDTGSVLADLHIPPGWDQRVPIDRLTEEVRQAFTFGPEPVELTGSVLAVVA
jgi:pyrimidine-nucleoside phosphorylase